jgi:hypothetical protein
MLSRGVSSPPELTAGRGGRYQFPPWFAGLGHNEGIVMMVRQYAFKSGLSLALLCILALAPAARADALSYCKADSPASAPESNRAVGASSGASKPTRWR